MLNVSYRSALPDVIRNVVEKDSCHNLLPPPPFESSKVLVTISRFNILNYAIYSFARRSLPCFLMHHYSSIRFQNIEQHCHCKESFFPNSLGNCLLLQEKQMKQMKKDKLPSDKNTPNICGILQSK